MTTQATDRQRTSVIRMLEEADTKSILLEAGFRPDVAYPSCLEWQYAKDNQVIKIGAGPGIIGWNIHAVSGRRRSMLENQFEVSERACRGELLRRIYKLWRSAFPDATVPNGLKPGSAYQDFLDLRKCWNPGTPHLDVNAKVLRFFINRLRTFDLIPPETTTLILRHTPNQLNIQVLRFQLFCPALGSWFGEVRTNLEQFLKIVPPRFSGGRAQLEFSEGVLSINGATVEATWSDC